MRGRNEVLKRASRILSLACLAALTAACGIVPRGTDAIDRSWYLGYCTAHEPKLAEGANPLGSEDMTMDAKGVLYISSNDYRLSLNTRARRAGAIYRYDVAQEGTVAPMRIRSESNRLPAYFEVNFFPHGISLLETKDAKRLFVINHRMRNLPRPADAQNLANVFDVPAGQVTQSIVEIFRIEQDGAGEILVHERSIADKGALATGTEPRGGRGFSLNDLVAVGPEQFLATNNPRGWRQSVDVAFFRNPVGNIVYFDGNSYSVVKDRVPYGNGINASADNTHIYLATILDGDVVTYRSNLNAPGNTQPEAVTLEEVTPRLRLGGHLDNIEWLDGKKKEFLVASHANLPALGLEAYSAPVTAPSRIMRFAVGPDGKPDPTSAKLIYSNNGDQVSAASVATYFTDEQKERLIIGSVFDERFLVCKLEAH